MSHSGPTCTHDTAEMIATGVVRAASAKRMRGLSRVEYVTAVLSVLSVPLKGSTAENAHTMPSRE